MTSYINVHLQLTKDVLQAITKDRAYAIRYNHVEKMISIIYKNVQFEALYGKKTKYIYNIDYNFHSCHHLILENKDHVIADLIQRLKSEFTGCKIEYVETKGYDGSVIERIIVIDWS
uniref:Uncharacterized protein n=1 Tax=viral metagenome TaxID=1070528 RepID=A0A6C0D6L0_9ZZZZ